MDNYPPQIWANSCRAYEDGSMECACYWCNEAMLFFPEDTVAVVTTKLNEFAGLQCQKCARIYVGRHAFFPCRHNPLN
jgi:uncharacterized protein with PIN domain